jgi:hypothetical protein
LFFGHAGTLQSVEFQKILDPLVKEHQDLRELMLSVFRVVVPHTDASKMYRMQHQRCYVHMLDLVYNTLKWIQPQQLVGSFGGGDGRAGDGEVGDNTNENGFGGVEGGGGGGGRGSVGGGHMVMYAITYNMLDLLKFLEEVYEEASRKRRGRRDRTNSDGQNDDNHGVIVGLYHSVDEMESDELIQEVPHHQEGAQSDNNEVGQFISTTTWTSPTASTHIHANTTHQRIHKLSYTHFQLQNALMNTTVNSSSSTFYSLLPLISHIHSNLSDSSQQPLGSLDSFVLETVSSNGNLEVLIYLHDELHVSGGWSCRVWDRAAGSGNLEILKWLKRARGGLGKIGGIGGIGGSGGGGKGSRRVEWFTGRGMDDAASMGYLEVLDWMYECRYEVAKKVTNRHGRHAAHAEGENDDDDRRGDDHEDDFSVCECSVEAWEGASLGGYLHVLKWLYARYVRPSSKVTLHRSSETYSHTPSDTSGPEYVTVTLWKPTTLAMTHAIKSGHTDVVQWLCEIPEQPKCALEAFVTATMKGHAELLTWFLREGYTHWLNESNVIQDSDGDLDSKQADNDIDESVDTERKDPRLVVLENLSEGAIWRMVTEGYLEMLQVLNGEVWDRFQLLRTYKPKLRDRSMTTRAMFRQKRRLRNLHWESIESYVSLMDFAAELGHLEILKYLHLRCPQVLLDGCTPHALNMASLDGHLEIVKYIQTHNLIKDFDVDGSNPGAAATAGCWSAMDHACKNNHFDIAQYLHTHRLEGCSEQAFNRAASEGHLRILIWLFEHYPSRCQETSQREKCFEEALMGGDHLEVCKWMWEVLGERGSKRAYKWAKELGCWQVMKWMDDEFGGKDGTGYYDLKDLDDVFDYSLALSNVFGWT